MTTVRPVLRRIRFVFPIAIIVSAGAALSAAPPTFSTKRVINTPINGLLPFDVRTVDVDQDGDLDVYSANYSGRVAWFENDGGQPPAWVEHVVTDFADGALAAVAARVDGDADVDFLSAAFNRDEIAWYDNNGDGQTWTTVPITYTARLAADVWAADLDGDGDSDAISASGYDGAIVWYENTSILGNSWTERVISPAAAECVEAADLDQDGDIDVVAGAAWFDSDGGSPPAFRQRLLTTLPVVANAIAVLDVDRDGDPDVLAAGQQDDSIAWFENDGLLPPGWTRHVVSTTADFATSVYAADLDGDADMDLLSSSYMDDKIAWHENDGASPSTWTERAISTTAMGARSAFAADLDEDGDVDVLSASQNDGKIVWHVNEADYPDADHDGMRDELDCAPGDGMAFAVPREVSGVRFRSSTLLEWNSAVAGSGGGARHDVVRGALSELPPGSGSDETCLASNTPGRSLTDGTFPATGAGFYYVVRASNACGTGTFGAGPQGAPRDTETCP